MAVIEHQGLKYEDYWYTLKYFKGGRVAHLVAPSELAACGMYPYHGEWRGTGSHDEREKAEKLPICGQCRNRVEKNDPA